MGGCCTGQAQVQDFGSNRGKKYGISSDYQQGKANKQAIKQSSGLANIGNTCYMNSGLQCLFHTTALTNKINIRYKGQFARQYKNVYNKINHSQSFEPKQLKRLIENYNPQFKGNRQNDAGQLVNTVINLIAQETNVVVNPSKIWSQIQNHQEEPDERLCQRYIKRDEQRSKSLIDQVITGRFKTTYKCSNCDYQERLFEKYNLIYLPLPKNTKLITLQDCIQQFNKPDSLSSWDCSKCGKECEHKKTMSIYQANKVLIFSFKRFAVGHRKNKTHVDIPNQLSLRVKTDKQGLSQNIYELYGVIKHVGELQSGHYTALCLNQDRNQWYHYNDKKVSLISSQMLKQNQRDACIVFYKLKTQSQNPPTNNTQVPL